MDFETEGKDGKLDDRQTWKSPTRTTITTSIGVDVWELAKREHISWTDALEFGVKFLVADKEGLDYPESTNLWTKLQKIIKQRNALQMQVNGLLEQVESADDETEKEKSVDEVFDNIMGEKKDE